MLTRKIAYGRTERSVERKGWQRHTVIDWYNNREFAAHAQKQGFPGHSLNKFLLKLISREELSLTFNPILLTRFAISKKDNTVPPDVDNCVEKH